MTLKAWADACLVWSVWWRAPTGATNDVRLSIACADQLLRAAVTMQRVRAAVLGAGRGQPPGGPPGAMAELQQKLVPSLWHARAGLLALAGSRLRPLEAKALDWGAWRRCLAHLGELLRGGGWEAPHPAQLAEPQVPGVPAHEVLARQPHDAWQAGCQLAAALMHDGGLEDAMGMVPAEEALEAAALLVKLVHALVGAAGWALLAA